MKSKQTKQSNQPKRVLWIGERVDDSYIADAIQEDDDWRIVGNKRWIDSKGVERWCKKQSPARFRDGIGDLIEIYMLTAKAEKMLLDADAKRTQEQSEAAKGEQDADDAERDFFEDAR